MRTLLCKRWLTRLCWHDSMEHHHVTIKCLITSLMEMTQSWQASSSRDGAERQTHCQREKVKDGWKQVNHRDNLHNITLYNWWLWSSLRSHRISESILQFFLTIEYVCLHFITKLENIQSVGQVQQKLQSRQTAQFHLQCYLSFYFNKKKCQFSSYSSST